MVISIFSIAFVSAIDFDFNFGEDIEVDKEFIVSIDDSDVGEDIFDVKIFVHEDSKEYSEIFNGTEWKNPYFYLTGTFPSQKEFKIISHYIGETNICVKLRKSGSSDSDEICKDIIVKEGADSQDNLEDDVQPEDDLEIDDETEDGDGEDDSGDRENEMIIEGGIKKTEYEVKDEMVSIKKDNKKIILNSGSDVKEKTSYISQEEKIRMGVLYGFIGLCIMIIIFLALNKL